jgi:hypothetical protein
MRHMSAYKSDMEKVKGETWDEIERNRTGEIYMEKGYEI